MFFRILLFVSILIFPLTLKAQNIFQARVVDHENNQPIPGATVYIEALNKGEITDQNGEIVITGIPSGEYTIQIRFLGYETITISRTFPLADNDQNQTFELHHSHEEHEEIMVTSTRTSRTIEDIPTRVEVIAGEELSEKGNMKPGDIRMLLNESTGIQTQQTSATSYNSSIRIQGLDGKYTQLLRDGLPLYSGFSGGLSLMQIAPLDLKQVEVIKGSSSTLYGGGAIAGLVNLISKTPGYEPEFSFMLNTTSALGLDFSSFISARNEHRGVTVFASYNKGTAYDPADIGLTAIPEFDRFTFNPKLFFYPSEQTTINAGINLIAEDRLGGNIDFIKDEEVTDPYFEENKTMRISSQFQLDHQLNERTSLTLKNSFNYYDRSVEIPDYLFSGQQFSSFSEAVLAHTNSSTEWITGLNLWTDSFDQEEGSQDLGFSDLVLGAFTQNIWNVPSAWTLETGLRLDYHNEYGAFALPRISVMFEPSTELTFRLGGGMGYKTPTVFTEDTERLQFRNIRPLDLSNNLSAERSFGTNFDINYQTAISGELSLSTNILFFYTQIQDPLVLIPIANQFEFQQPNGFVDTKGVELNMKWSYDHFKLFIGYTFADVQSHYNGTTSSFPLVAKHRLNNVLMYEKHGEFWIGLEVYYFSPQRLGDGSKGKSYWITGLMTEKVLNETFSIFLNFENFLDTRQTGFDTIYTGSLSDPNFRDIYAPVDGFVINGGFKVKL
ncbi:MAG: TonB-dependent receptor [Balneola sp.]